VFLKIVPNTWDISSYFHSVRQTHSRNLSDGGVRLLWSFGGNFSGYSALKRRIIEYRPIFNGIKTARQSNRLGLAGDFLSFVLDKLINSAHYKNLPAGRQVSPKREIDTVLKGALNCNPGNYIE